MNEEILGANRCRFNFNKCRAKCAIDVTRVEKLKCKSNAREFQQMAFSSRQVEASAFKVIAS